MKKLFIVFVLFIISLFGGDLKAQDQNSAISGKINKKVIANFISAIKSDNEGLKRSAIYLAGKYKIGETVDELSKILSSDNSENVKFASALALYEIGDPKGLDAIFKSSLIDQNEFIKKLCASIYYDYGRYLNYELPQ